MYEAGCFLEVIMRGVKGDPLWPVGVKGSITHDLQQVIAVVGSDPGIKGVGLDLILKPSGVENHLQPLIATDSELFCLGGISSRILPLALAFGLKESVVKAVSPSIDYYIDLLDVTITNEGCCLVARLLKVEGIFLCEIFELEEGFVTLSVWK